VFYIGCPMWGYKEWVGNFFPRHTPPSDFLQLYSRRLTAVEGNTVFAEFTSRDGDEQPMCTCERVAENWLESCAVLGCYDEMMGGRLCHEGLPFDGSRCWVHRSEQRRDISRGSF
jgi:hypothetical protein